eukprot:1415723-Pyramimonas_sp.AAC.1
MTHGVMFQVAQWAEHAGGDLPVLHRAALGPGAWQISPRIQRFSHGVNLLDPIAAKGTSKRALLRPRLSP